MLLEQREKHQEWSIETLPFQTRFFAALDHPPIQGILFQDKKLTPLFAEGLAKVDAACWKRQICHHGLDHLVSVSQNALVLMDMVQKDHRTDISSAFSDAEIIFPVLIHDMGYGFNSVIWQNQDAINHAEQGVNVMERFGRRALPKVVGEAHTSLQLLERHTSLYRYAILSSPKSLLNHARGNAAMEGVTPQRMLPLVIAVADKLDYFREKRVTGLSLPERYEDNPYFFLAGAVLGYKLTYDAKVLYYKVRLKRNFQIPTQAGQRILDPQLWRKQTEGHYAFVWDLIRGFANLMGREFVVEIYQD